MKLNEYLESQGVKISDMSRRLDIHRNYLSDIAKGKKTPSLPLAYEIQEFTNGMVRTEDLIASDKIRPICPCCGRKMPKPS